MATIVNPNTRGGEAKRCTLEIQHSPHSEIFQNGGPHIVIKITTNDGKTGVLELSAKEADDLGIFIAGNQDFVPTIPAPSPPTTPKTWAEIAIESSKK